MQWLEHLYAHDPELHHIVTELVRTVPRWQLEDWAGRLRRYITFCNMDFDQAAEFTHRFLQDKLIPLPPDDERWRISYHLAA